MNPRNILGKLCLAFLCEKRNAATQVRSSFAAHQYNDKALHLGTLPPDPSSLLHEKSKIQFQSLHTPFILTSVYKAVQKPQNRRCEIERQAQELLNSQPGLVLPSH